MVRWQKLFVLCVVLFLLSGCTLLRQPSALIQSPNLTQSNRQLLKAVSRLLPAGARLITPASSTIKGKIMFLQLQKDSQGQAAFFYETSDGKIYFSILTRKGRNWEPVYNEKLAAETAMKTALVNQGQAASPQLIVTTERSSQDQLRIFSMSDGRVHALLSAPFNGWIQGWVDHDQRRHLAFTQNLAGRRRLQLVDYLMDGHEGPVLDQRKTFSPGSGHDRLLQKNFYQEPAILTDPGIAQLNQLNGPHVLHLNDASALAGSRSDNSERLGSERSLFPQEPGGSIWMIRGLGRNTFYPISGGRPVERYYNDLHHFFIDFPENIAGDLTLTEETNTHIAFSARYSGLTYLAVYWFPRNHFDRNDYPGWTVVGISDHYVYMVPKEYRAGTSEIRFGIYHQELDVLN